MIPTRVAASACPLFGFAAVVAWVLAWWSRNRRFFWTLLELSLVGVAILGVLRPVQPPRLTPPCC
jgi:hypothetical protein